MTKRKPHKKHWYKIYGGPCIVCGENNSTRVRVYGNKPKDPNKCCEPWVKGEHSYCGCEG